MRSKATPILCFIALISGVANAESKGTYISAEVAQTSTDAEVQVAGVLANATAAIEPSAEFDSDVSWGLAIGYRLDNGLSLELEYTTMSFTTDDAPQTIPVRAEWEAFLEGATTEDFIYTGEAEIHNYALNLAYHYQSSSRWTPFVRLGYGYAEVDVTTNYSEQPRFDVFALPSEVFEPSNSSGSTWNIGLGVAWRLNEVLEFELEYVQSDYDTDGNTGTVESGNSIEYRDFSNGRIALGIRFWM
ncbi:MAG: outer membrane beta-barrel protein [Pseudomonadota bacterium]